MHIIPAIDLIGGKCVRLSQGDYAQMTTYNENPLEVAKMFEGSGITKLHLVDLDGAKEKRIINHKVLERIATHTSLEVDFGGGLQSDEDLKIAFESGAKQITGGSIAVKRPQKFLEWLLHYGSQKIILGADVKDRKIAVHGWQEQSEVELMEFLQSYVQAGVRYCISTDVAKDGMLQGPSLDLYKDIQSRFGDLHLIASGGVSSMEDIYALQQLGIYGVIVGKAIYEGRITLHQLADLSR